MSTTMTSEARVVASRKRRSTGTTVELIDRGKGVEPRWLTRCVEHDTTAEHASGRDARKAGRAPEQWCSKCKAAKRRQAAAAARAAS